MHEYSIVQALLDRVLDEARSREASAVHRIKVRIGELSGVEPELLASAYTLCRERTLCAEAKLDLERVPARWGCSDCGRAPEPGAALRCPACGGPARLTQGDEILLESIEMEVA
jgi:hydrogenase nickel incorporation protein HypA/HybF